MDERDFPQTLYPSRWSSLGLLALCSLFVAGGIWLGRTEGPLWYWTAVFFALGIPVAIVQLLPGSTYLHLSANGLKYRNLYRDTTLDWNALDKFFVITLKRSGLNVHKLVAYDLKPSHKGALLTKANRSIAKCDGALPNTYGLKAEQLVDLLNACVARFADQATTSTTADA